MPARYDAAFYRGLREASGEGASLIVPQVLDWVRPSSIVDLGCGVGSWLRVFATGGVDDLLGLDQPSVPRDALEIPDTQFRAVDLSQPIDIDREFDLALCLEVGEHLPEPATDGLIDTLTRLAPTVLFSAAIPHQTGTGHLTCRWPAYWADRFAVRGFEQYDILRPRLWADDRVPNYYRQNLLLYAHPARSPAAPRLAGARAGGDFGGAALVHPQRWEALHDPERVPLSQVAHVAPRAALRAARLAIGRVGRHLRS